MVLVSVLAKQICTPLTINVWDIHAHSGVFTSDRARVNLFLRSKLIQEVREGTYLAQEATADVQTAGPLYTSGNLVIADSTSVCTAGHFDAYSCFNPTVLKIAMNVVLV